MERWRRMEEWMLSKLALSKLDHPLEPWMTNLIVTSRRVITASNRLASLHFNRLETSKAWIVPYNRNPLRCACLVLFKYE